jgi:CRP-like cAMP-binding protein
MRSTNILGTAAMSTYAAQLRTSPGLEHLQRPAAARLAQVAERIDVPAGGEIFDASDRWAGAYVVLHGDAVLETPGWEVLLGPGSLLCRTQATEGTRLTARTDVRLLAIGRQSHDAIAALSRAFNRRGARCRG